jgi:hypothetical protein
MQQAYENRERAVALERGQYSADQGQRKDELDRSQNTVAAGGSLIGALAS